MKVILSLAVLLLLDSGEALAQRAATPADATVFIRLVGSVHADLVGPGLRETIDRNRVEVATGSGFVISPNGYVLTNEHVINSSEFVLTDGINKATVTIKGARIEVCLPASASAARGDASGCVDASVHSSDPALDVAVLYVGASNFPYLALGDSDVVRAGQGVEALGYPFGRALEIGRGTNVAPEVTTTSGTITALRAGDTGERRFIQISNSVNPGNSGGPLVDRDGYAVGVIRLRLNGANSIGFAIPINQVKDFLESRGLDQLMPVRRLRPGSLQTIEHKGIALRIPEGLADSSPFRARVETDTRSGDVALRIDRGFSRWSARQFEQALIASETFERFETSTHESQTSTQGGVPILLGRANGTIARDSREGRMEYGILGLGPETLIARYVGSAEQLAYNASVVRESLASLEGRLLASQDSGSVQSLEWLPTTNASGQNSLTFPAGWFVEPGMPTSCAGLPQASSASTLYPVHDFTVSLRAAVWETGNVSPEQAASACSPRRGSAGSASYLSRAEWLGVSYSIEGTFVRLASGSLAQLEVIAPDQKSAFARALLAAWIKKSTEP